MRILGPPTATKAGCLDRVAAQGKVHARFAGEMFPALWEAAVARFVDPVGVIAQAGKETSWGNYSGKVRPEFYNTAGIKVRHLGLFPGVDDGDNPLAHQRFANWTEGAIAHVQHLCAYAGVPVLGLIVDPRFELVSGPPAETFEELGGKWAPSAKYGTELVTIAKRLQTTV